jgi:hypothetical protein
MNKEEIKEYLKRADELELKLTGEDKDTYQWVLFGYNECARLLNEKEQESTQLKSVIKEIREYIKEHIKEDSEYTNYMEMRKEKYNELLQILDKGVQ